MTTFSTALPMARRVKFHDARRAFATGARVLVSEYGDELFCCVGPNTTTHTRETIAWTDLAAQVAMWRSRYPHQRFYVVEEAGTPVGQAQA